MSEDALGTMSAEYDSASDTEFDDHHRRGITRVVSTVTPLKGKANYMEWAATMRLHLKRDRLWYMITDPPQVTSASTVLFINAVKRDRSRALLTLHQALDPKLPGSWYVEIDDPKELWEELGRRFGDRQPSTQVTLTARLAELRYGDFEPHTTHFHMTFIETVSRLNLAGALPSQLTIVSCFIRATRDSYPELQQQIEEWKDRHGGKWPSTARMIEMLRALEYEEHLRQLGNSRDSGYIE
ncbi:hypothetical protein BX600DRAFT_28673 [Xylariales sp. PMI_506]|nr:hypothetical protein BX600DRAFT_28673 [Xylariales sp. PMI_506]